MPFLSRSQLKQIGFRTVGREVEVSSHAVFYNPGNIDLGDHCRIDDFCLFSAGAGGIRIGDYVHIGAYTSLIGKGEIIFEALSGTSGRVSVYSSNEDFSGNFIALPTVPEEFRRAASGPVRICRHVAIGAGAIILPDLTVGTGAVVGALSLVKGDCREFGVYSGVPARLVGYRLRKLLEHEARILGS